MGQARLRTVRAGDEVGHRHLVMIGAAHVALRTAFSSLGNRHGTTPSYFVAWPTRGAARDGDRLGPPKMETLCPRRDGYLHKPRSTRGRWEIREEWLPERTGLARLPPLRRCRDRLLQRQIRLRRHWPRSFLSLEHAAPPSFRWPRLLPRLRIRSARAKALYEGEG